MNEGHEGRIADSYGPRLEDAECAAVMLHGRGDSAQGILQLAREFDAPRIAFVAPQATGNSWYPHSFLAPLEQNQPWLDSALAAVGAVLARLEEAGVPPERVALIGFSQGACLASEFAARQGGRFGAIIALSGGLIGPPGIPRNYGTDLAGTPAFLGCSDVDAHIPVERVHETQEVLELLGADVEKRIYPGMGHTVNRDEVAYVAALLQKLRP